MSLSFSKASLSLSLVSLFLASNAYAQSSINGLDIHGSLDFYFQNSPQAHRTVPTTPQGPLVLEGRYFDRHHNTFTLNMAEVSVQKKTESLSWRVDLGAGEMVDQLSGGSSQSVTTTNPTNFAANEPTRYIMQATLQYQINPQWLVTVGKFFTPIGLEGTRAKDNMQYSRSYLFNYGPFWHQGAIVTYKAIPDMFTVNTYLINSWDGRISAETNDSPSAILNLNYSPNSNITLNYNYFNGQETTSNVSRELHEINASWIASERYTIATDIQYATQEVPSAEKATWSGAAVYLKAKITENYSISPRYEYFNDEDGVAIVGALSAPSAVKQNINAWTLTNTYLWAQGLETRLEFRHDQSSDSGFFLNRDGDASDAQFSSTLALLYAF